MKNLYKYLFFLVLGIILYILLNGKDGFSVGVPTYLIKLNNGFIDTIIETKTENMRESVFDDENKYYAYGDNENDALINFLQFRIKNHEHISMTPALTNQTGEDLIPNLVNLCLKIYAINNSHVNRPSFENAGVQYEYTDIGIFTVLKKIQSLNRDITNKNIALVCGFSLEYYSNNFIDEDIIIYYDIDNKALEYARQCAKNHYVLYPDSTKIFLFVNLDILNQEEIYNLFQLINNEGFSLTLLNFTNIFEVTGEINNSGLTEKGRTILRYILIHKCVSDNAFFMFCMSELTTIALNYRNVYVLTSSQLLSNVLVPHELNPLVLNSKKQYYTAEQRFNLLLNNPLIYNTYINEYRLKIINDLNSRYWEWDQFILCKQYTREIIEIFEKTTNYFNSLYWTWDQTTNILVSDELIDINGLLLLLNESYSENPETLNNIFFENLKEHALPLSI